MPSIPAGARVLPLAGAASANDASCACCGPADSAHSTTTGQTAAAAAGVGAAGAGAAGAGAETSVTAEYRVAGLTCGNCVSHVTADLSELDGVRCVEVELVAGGVSTVRVASDRMLDPSVVAETVADGGYELVGA